jgi:hypothetical protein
MPTLPVVNAPELAQNIDRVQEQIDREGSGIHSSGRLSTGDSRRPEWCVDFGSRLKPMTTFELWIAVGNGNVGPETRVWRDGMECWRRVRTIPELVHALPEPLRPGAAEATGTPPPTVRERSRSEITPLVRPASRQVHAERREAFGRPEAYSRTLPYRSTVLAVTIGAVVGFGALFFALGVTGRIESPAVLRASQAAHVPAARPFAPYARELSDRAAEWAAAVPVEVDLDLSGEELVYIEEAGFPRRSPVSPRRDPGQRRIRGGSRP